MVNFSQLKKNLEHTNGNLIPLRVALLGDSSTQLLSIAIKGMGVNYGFLIDLWEADFNQVELQLLTPTSDLYSFNPELIIIFHSSLKLLAAYNKLDIMDYKNLAEERLNLISTIYSAITEKLNAKIFYYNYTEIDDAVFGNYSNKLESSFLFQLRKLNYFLMEFAVSHPDFHVCDLSTIQNRLGSQILFQPSIYTSTEMVLSIDVLPQAAALTLDIISAIKGKLHKCLILDLDNTLWGGVVGDIGMENIQLGNLGIGKAFKEFQYWIKKLKNRGIILCICSKNTEATAKEPFEKHPEMVLRLEDITIFIANWDNKVDNMKEIQRILNIGFDSMVFLDDNPFERNFVRESIPGIAVPELPEDPADYLEFLYSLNLFESVSFSREDLERTKMYQDEARRTSALKSFTNENDYLRSLTMLSIVEPLNIYNIPRVAQLSQRSNQFNLRTLRYSESDLQKMILKEDYFSFVFTLEDKFGDHGIICVIILKEENSTTLFIENWFMSCRVLKRGMEHFALNSIVNLAKEKGFKKVKGEYLQTPKNVIVRNHYQDLGFEKIGSYWLLDVNDYLSKECFIKIKESVGYELL